MSTPLETYRKAAAEQPQNRGVCRLLGCDEPSAAQIVIQLRERQRHLAGKAVTLCEGHAITFYEQFARALAEGPS